MTQKIQKFYSVKADKWKQIGKSRHIRKGFIVQSRVDLREVNNQIEFLLEDSSRRQHRFPVSLSAAQRLAELKIGNCQISVEHIDRKNYFLCISSKDETDQSPIFKRPIDATTGKILMEECGKRVLEKQNYWLKYGDHTWQINEYKGTLAGLTIASIQQDPNEMPAHPNWVQREIKDHKIYLENRLAFTPPQKLKQGKVAQKLKVAPRP